MSIKREVRSNDDDDGKEQLYKVQVQCGHNHTHIKRGKFFCLKLGSVNTIGGSCTFLQS